jgi:hypothetical protein
MGDTLAHLPDRQTVERLFAEVAEALEGGGTFIVTFRDYSTPLIGLKQRVSRSKSNRALLAWHGLSPNGRSEQSRR